MNAAGQRADHTLPDTLLITGSSEDMRHLDDESVTLTVTSPAYWNAIDYDVHAQRGEQDWYRSQQYSPTGDDFGPWRLPTAASH